MKTKLAELFLIYWHISIRLSRAYSYLYLGKLRLKCIFQRHDRVISANYIFSGIDLVDFKKHIVKCLIPVTPLMPVTFIFFTLKMF